MPFRALSPEPRARARSSSSCLYFLGVESRWIHCMPGVLRRLCAIAHDAGASVTGAGRLELSDLLADSGGDVRGAVIRDDVRAEAARHVREPAVGELAEQL